MPRSLDDHRFGDGRLDGHARVERTVGILKDDLHAAAKAAKFAAVKCTQIGAIEQNLAARGFDQPQQCPAGGRLAAAAFAHEAERLAFVDLETDAIDSADVIDRRGRAVHDCTGKWTVRFSTSRSGRVFSATAVVSAARGVCSQGWPIAASSDLRMQQRPATFGGQFAEAVRRSSAFRESRLGHRYVRLP